MKNTYEASTGRLFKEFEPKNSKKQCFKFGSEALNTFFRVLFPVVIVGFMIAHAYNALAAKGNNIVKPK